MLTGISQPQFAVGIIERYIPSLFQDHSLSLVELESGFTQHGPFSESSPSIEELPGPPFIHIDSGALAGSFRASKNQKKVLIL
jgi:hypothetical protein